MSKLVIEKIDGNNIYYKCKCGVFGKCIFKPLSFIGESVVRIKCPSCLAEETVILKEDGEEFNENTFYSFAIILNNKVRR
jgi:hypothetical protein